MLSDAGILSEEGFCFPRWEVRIEPMISSSKTPKNFLLYYRHIFHNFPTYRIYIYVMLFAGWEVRVVKNCDRVLETAAEGSIFKPDWSQFFTIRTLTIFFLR